MNFYFDTGLIIGFIFWGIFGVFWLGEFCLILKQWVNDERLEIWVPPFLLSKFDIKDGTDFSFYCLRIFIASLVLPFVWPIIIIGFLILGSLLPLRGFIRFRKKVDKALELKETEKV